MSLILPPKVQFDLEREAWAEQQETWARRFSKELRGLDPRLSLVWIKDTAPEYGGLVPGRWHVRRKNDRGPDSYMAIAGPDGEYIEPHSGVFEDLRRNDLWRGSVTERLWKRRTDEAKRKAKKLEAARAERTQELAQRVKAAESPGVAFTDRPWTYRAGVRSQA